MNLVNQAVDALMGHANGGEAHVILQIWIVELRRIEGEILTDAASVV